MMVSDGVVGRGSATGVAGDGVEAGADVILDSVTGPASFTFASFFLITPLSSDLTVFLEGAETLFGLEADGSGTAVGAAFGRCGGGSSVGDGIGADLCCIRLADQASVPKSVSHGPRRDSLERRQLLGIMHLNLALSFPFETRRLVEKLQFIRIQASKLVGHTHLFIPFFLFGFLLNG